MGMCKSKIIEPTSAFQIHEVNISNIFSQEYSLGDELTVHCRPGSYVYTGSSRHEDTKVWITITSKSDLNPRAEQSIKKEMELLKSLDHPNIIKFLNFFSDDSKFYLVTEALDGGEYFDYVARKTDYSERDARDAIVCVLSAIKEIHKVNIAHRLDSTFL